MDRGDPLAKGPLYSKDPALFRSTKGGDSHIL